MFIKKRERVGREVKKKIMKEKKECIYWHLQKKYVNF